jgi:DNA-binding response OmpR family regulator
MPENEKRILVVDDDDAIRALLLTILRRRGLKVDTARNGVEGLERCARCRYSVVLLDLMMPMKSGWDFLAELRLLTHEMRPVVFVLTAGTLPRTVDPELVAGVLRKPFDIELLVATVTACLQTSAGHPQPENCPTPDSERAPN